MSVHENGRVDETQPLDRRCDGPANDELGFFKARSDSTPSRFDTSSLSSEGESHPWCNVAAQVSKVRRSGDASHLRRTTSRLSPASRITRGWETWNGDPDGEPVSASREMRPLRSARRVRWGVFSDAETTLRPDRDRSRSYTGLRRSGDRARGPEMKPRRAFGLAIEPLGRRRVPI